MLIKDLTNMTSYYSGKQVKSLHQSSRSCSFSLQPFSPQTESTDSSHEAFAERAAENFVGRKTAIKQCFEVIATSNKTKCGVLMVSGKTGCGKTSFMVCYIINFCLNLNLC